MPSAASWSAVTVIGPSAAVERFSGALQRPLTQVMGPEIAAAGMPPRVTVRLASEQVPEMVKVDALAAVTSESAAGAVMLTIGIEGTTAGLMKLRFAAGATLPYWLE